MVGALNPDAHEQILPLRFGEAFGDRGAALAESNSLLFHPLAAEIG